MFKKQTIRRPNKISTVIKKRTMNTTIVHCPFIFFVNCCLKQMRFQPYFSKLSSRSLSAYCLSEESFFKASLR